MSYTGISQELAYQAFQKAALPHIAHLTYQGGGHEGWLSARRTGKWDYLGDHWGGLCWQHGREIVQFDKLQFVKADVHSGIAVPVGELENHYAIIGTVENDTPEDAEHKVEYQRGESSSLESQESQTHGWNVRTWLEGQSGGGEASGGSYLKAGIEVGAHGEYSKGMKEGTGESDLATLTTTLTVPKHSERDIQQLIQRGKARVEFTHKGVLDPKFWCIGYKHLRHHQGFIEGNDDWTKWGHTRSRKMWQADGIADLFAILTGQSGEYRNRTRNWMDEDKWIRKAYEWLADEGNRTLEFKTTAIFDRSLKSHVRLSVG